MSGLDLDSTMSLLPAADKYCLDDLKDLCEDALVGKKNNNIVLYSMSIGNELNNMYD